MLLSQIEIETMKSRYPDEKPVAFNFMQAREDFMRLAEAYNTLLSGLQGLTPENILCQMEKKKFLVLIDSSYVRDAHFSPQTSSSMKATILGITIPLGKIMRNQ